MTKKRVEEIDIMKAIGIILMVFGHSGAPGTGFVFLFHMAIFFMASGFFYKPAKDIGGVVQSIKGKVKRLWFTYVCWQTIYILLNNIFLRINFYTDNPELLDYVAGTKRMNMSSVGHYYGTAETLRRIVKSMAFLGTTKMGGPMWFLGTLFFICATYCIIDFLIRSTVKSEYFVWLIHGIIACMFINTWLCVS